jgi:HK97 family phage major capsid protein
MSQVLTLEELVERQQAIQSRLAEINTEFAGRHMPDETRSEWEGLGEEYRANEDLIAELEAREQTLANLATDDQSQQRREAGFHVRAPSAPSGQEIYDLVAVRQASRSMDDEARTVVEYAMRSVEAQTYPEQVGNNAAREHIARLMARFGEDAEPEVGLSRQAAFARRLLLTGSDVYRTAFLRYITGRPRTPEQERALSQTGSAGGFALVYTLDPTIIPTSNLSVNPYRTISRNETIVGTNEWRGVTSAGVTASYGAELTQASDNAPTLAQPAAIVDKAQCFIPFSIEIGQDWSGLQTEMAGLIQDAKDDVEATKFSLGSGHGSNEPEGVLTGATTVVTAAGTASFAVADVYKVWEALGPRFRPRAQWVGNLAQYDRVRQFDTAGGASLFIQNLTIGFQNQPPTPGNMGAQLLGRPANECSAMSSVLTTGALILTVGDWRYFVIVDRVGLDVEVIPHLMGASGRPLGQRGLYAYWRNTSKVLDTNAFRILKTG